MYVYMYMKNITIGPLYYCSPQAASIQRFDFDFHARRRANNCQYLKNIVSFTKQVQNRAHTKVIRQSYSK